MLNQRPEPTSAGLVGATSSDLYVSSERGGARISGFSSLSRGGNRMRHLFVFVMLIATLGGTAYSQGKRMLKECLTSGCTKLTIAFDLSSIGMAIQHARQGQSVYSELLFLAS